MTLQPSGPHGRGQTQGKNEKNKTKQTNNKNKPFIFKHFLFSNITVEKN